MKTLGLLILSLWAWGISQSLKAQETFEGIQEREISFRGWDHAWRFDFQGLLVNNKSVIGKTEGTSLTLGGKTKAELAWIADRHEWTNEFSIELQFHRDPSLKSFTKSLDRMRFESLYLYKFQEVNWVGPFARFIAETALLSATDVRTENKTYVITERDGSLTTRVDDRLRLTDPFRPLNLQQSVGAYFKPIQQPYAQLMILFGATARETFAQGELAIRDQDGTAAIEVQTLRHIYQLGTELDASLKGKLNEERLHYQIGARYLTPWLNNMPSNDDRSAWDLTRILLESELSYHFADWIRLAYEFQALKDPQLLNRFQIRHDAKVIIGFDIFKSQRS